jgi:hypothetical protein
MLQFLLGGDLGVLAQDTAHEAPPVGMNAIRGVTDQHIADGDGGGVDQIRFFGAADAETGQLHNAFGHDARHFRRFPPR